MKASNPHYDTEAPDTLRLADRGELALNGLCGTLDPDNDYQMYFEVRANARPPYMTHSGCDVECAPKFLESIMQMRVMSGSDKFRDIEHRMLEELTGYVSEDDGLYYAMHNPKRPWHMDAYVGDGCTADADEDYAIPFTSGMLMTALMHLREQSGEDRWDGIIQGIARGFESVAIDRGDYAYWPDGGVAHPFTRPRSSGWPHTKEPAGEHEGGEGTVVAFFGYPIRALSMWAARTGDERSLELAGKLARFVMKPKFWGGFHDDTHRCGRERGHVNSHFHARAIALRGLLEYALVTGDAEIGRFVQGSYEYMRTFGLPELGFTPCFTGFQMTGGAVGDGMMGYMEACMLGDMTAMAAKLSQSGLGDYWEDVDRIARNHLVEGQWTDRGAIERIVAHSIERPTGAPYHLGPYDNNRQPFDQHPGLECAGDEVLDRAMGIYFGYLGAVSTTWARTMQCCTGNATRGLYYAWDSITHCDGDSATVNLLMNRASAWLDIDSYLPYEGRAVIRNKTARRLSVRVPAWAQRSQVRVTVNGADRSPWWVYGRLTFDQLAPGDEIELRFPLSERTVTRTAHSGTERETAYTIQLRGNTAVDVSPRDDSPTSYPYYRRDHMKAAEAPMRTVSRYAAPVAPRW